jgi:transposase-like protein
MERRKWDAKSKAMIVLQGFKGAPIAQLCNEHQISQAQYYKWRDQLLHNASAAFESSKQSHREARLLAENERLKRMLGELTLALKKSDEVLA